MTAKTEIDFSAGWQISPASTNEGPAASAAEELAHHLGLIAPQSKDAAAIRVSLGCREDANDGFIWNVSGNTVQLTGHSERGLLYAAMSFLSALGFAWPGHKVDDTCVPAGTIFSVPEVCAETPGFAGRCLILGHHCFLAEHGAWIRWAARNRLNTIFIHTAEEGLALGAAPVAQWHAVSTDVRNACARYGMVLEVGGHGLSRLLPRKLFDDMPDAFRMKDGERTSDHNLEPLNSDGMAIVRTNARDWFNANPGANVYHLWPDDIPGGGWSSSPESRELTASDQALIASNALAEELEAVSPDAEIAHIAYHDTEPAPTALRPRHNVSLLWAPRMRSYAQGAFESPSSVNDRYPDELAANIALFEDARAKPARVFEYYLDAILFKSVLPPLATQMALDARGYQAAGVHTLQALMVGGRPWNAPPLNAWCFARLAWDPDGDPATLILEFASLLVGPDAADDLAGHFTALADGFALALTLEPREAKPGAAAGAADFLDTPPTDMGDPWHATPEDISLRLGWKPVIENHLLKAEEALARASARASTTRHLPGLRAEFALARLWFDFHFARLSVYDAWHKRDTAGDAPVSEALDHARVFCDAVDAWSQVHVTDSRYQANTQLLHWLFWRLRLDWIREQIAPDDAVKAKVRSERESDMARRFDIARRLWTQAPETPITHSETS